MAGRKATAGWPGRPCNVVLAQLRRFKLFLDAVMKGVDEQQARLNKRSMSSLKIKRGILSSVLIFIFLAK
jgi:hypothetical protein